MPNNTDKAEKLLQSKTAYSRNQREFLETWLHNNFGETIEINSPVSDQGMKIICQTCFDKSYNFPFTSLSYSACTSISKIEYGDEVYLQELTQLSVKGAKKLAEGDYSLYLGEKENFSSEVVEIFECREGYTQFGDAG